MTTVALCPLPKLQFGSGTFTGSGCLLFTYVAGTTTKKATYTDSTGNSANTNPIVLNSRGECDAWILTDENYKFVLALPTDSDPPVAPLWTVDNFGFAAPTFQTATITGALTVGGTLTAGGINVGDTMAFAQTDQTQTITATTLLFTFPYMPACTINATRLGLATASSSGPVTFDIKVAGTSIYGATKLSCDVNETLSLTASTTPTISNPTVSTGSPLTLAVSTAGVGAKGWVLQIDITRT